jgi:CxxC motif-containing protein (DUF1111 family)
MKTKFAVPLLTTAIAALFFLQVDTATGDDPARDRGVRDGPPAAGGPLDGLEAALDFFTIGRADFNEEEDVDEGLGPRMNLNGCGTCHSQPDIGGSSPAVNPQVDFAGAATPSQLPAIERFIRADGPIREVRLVRNRDGTPNGGVINTFTITGRGEEAEGCNLQQHNFERELENRNIIFRIPTPLFGAGLIEQIPDATILANMRANSDRKRDLGISGRPNRNGNDGMISRFGWKAQNQSLLLFSGEAYNVEMGITSELFQVEREQDPDCQKASVPNDTQNFTAGNALEGTTAIQNFANFQRFLAPPAPSTDSPGGAESIGRGKSLFGNVGCALCHTPTLKTGDSTVPALKDKDANLYSDLLVHDMGDRLADGVSQGAAGPREFRTSPLWGLGQRIFFLHDGRTSDLKVAIREHASDGSEANRVIGRFNDLRESQKQDLLNFLRSL